MECETQTDKSRWTLERVARLGFLLGSGWDQKRIASDPIISCSLENVQCQANRYGLSLRDMSVSTYMRRLSPQHMAAFDAASAKRGITRQSLIRRLLIEMAEEPNLIENILDDSE